MRLSKPKLECIVSTKIIWFLLISVVILSCVGGNVIRVLPAPECFRPCSKENCSTIKCYWNPQPEVSSPYRLHWKSENSENGDMISGSSSQGVIHREQFSSHGELRVWVEVSNSLQRSEEVVYNVEHIIKPPPPHISQSTRDPLEISWSAECPVHHIFPICEVRFRKEGDSGWPSSQYEHELVTGSYAVVDPPFFTNYEFQVRCSCGQSLMSNWSETYGEQSTESTPIGKVDVWSDCGFTHLSPTCFITWKDLPAAQARGFILGYHITLLYSNGTTAQINVGTKESPSFGVHHENIWRHTSSLSDVASASVSAYSALGATNTSHLAKRVSGEKGNIQIRLEITQQSINVSWEPTFHPHVEQYVVEYRQCPPGGGFDWIKVDKNLNSAVFKGAFQNYTAYHVSLYAVSYTNEVHLLSSSTGYSVQGAPPKVPSFSVSSIDATEVTLLWEPVPCSQQNGVILYYQIVTDTHKVYNVSAALGLLKLRDLSPDKKYTVWIQAVTAAGAGENITTTFKTKQDAFSSSFWFIIGAAIFAFIAVTFAALLHSFNRRNAVCPFLPYCFYEKELDPSKSKIFTQMEHRIDEPFVWNCIPYHEPSPKISVLEVIEIPFKAFDLNGISRPVTESECPDWSGQDHQRVELMTQDSGWTVHKLGKEEYRRMVDSDEDKRENSSSDEEDQISSGYEKHFMPAAAEILEYMKFEHLNHGL